MPRIDESLTRSDWEKIVGQSNAVAMKKTHKYPTHEGSFLDECCVYTCVRSCCDSCYCVENQCTGVWTLKPDLDFQTFLRHFSNLWVRGAQSFIDSVNADQPPNSGRWLNGIRLLREVKKRWANWDGSSRSLPSLASDVKRCYFCDDAFVRIEPIVRSIRNLADDSTGVYTSKFVSQLFYDIAVPFDTKSAQKQRDGGYHPKLYGDGLMHANARDWLRRNHVTIDDFRRIDDTRKEWKPDPGHDTACSRVLDKLFYA